MKPSDVFTDEQETRVRCASMPDGHTCDGEPGRECGWEGPVADLRVADSGTPHCPDCNGVNLVASGTENP